MSRLATSRLATSRLAMSRLVPTLIILCVASPHVGVAAVVDETAIDQRVRDIAKTLRCTVCQTENIWESGAPLARQMRDAIRQRVTRGDSAEDIRAYFHSRYGDYIMMAPPKHGLHWLIWLAPLLLLIGGGVFLWNEINGWVTRTPVPRPDATPLDDASRRRIRRELAPPEE